jgi:DNA-directed RNA polymerase subunit K/omega
MEPRELETLLTEVGGKFKLVTLFQKRMRELQRGLPRLVLDENATVWDTVTAEIMEGKVDLIMGEEADQMRKELAAREAEEAPALPAGEKAKAEKPKVEKPAEEAKA